MNPSLFQEKFKKEFRECAHCRRCRKICCGIEEAAANGDPLDMAFDHDGATTPTRRVRLKRKRGALSALSLTSTFWKINFRRHSLTNLIYSAPTPQTSTSCCRTGGDLRHWATSPRWRATGPHPPLPSAQRPPLAGGPSSSHLSRCRRSGARSRRRSRRRRRVSRGCRARQCQTAKAMSKTPLFNVLVLRIKQKGAQS